MKIHTDWTGTIRAVVNMACEIERACLELEALGVVEPEQLVVRALEANRYDLSRTPSEALRETVRRAAAGA